jgi:hypothetical protein
MAEALALITARLAGAQTGVLGVQRGLEGWNRALIAVGSTLAAIAVQKGFMAIANSAKPLMDQQVNLLNAGLKWNEVLQLTARYYDDINKRIPTADSAKFLKEVGESRSIVGQRTWPTWARAGSIASASNFAEQMEMIDNLLGKEGETYKLLRSAEMKGIATDPKKRQEFLDASYSYIKAFGDKLSAQDFQTMARRGGAAWMHMDIGRAMGPAAVLAADIGGSAAGQSLMSLYQFQQGSMTFTRQQGEMMRKLGLIDMQKIKIVRGSGRWQMEPGAVQDRKSVV